MAFFTLIVAAAAQTRVDVPDNFDFQALKNLPNSRLVKVFKPLVSPEDVNNYNEHITEICTEREHEKFRNGYNLGFDTCNVFYYCERVRNKYKFRLKFIKCASEREYFDVEKQQCLHKAEVDNCFTRFKGERPLPALERPCTSPGLTRCGSSECLSDHFFCDGEFDCNDKSDENICEFGDRRNPNAASTCNRRDCKLPDCFCSPKGQSIPGQLKKEDTPQIILINIDGAVFSDNMNIYREFLDGIKNPNGCPIKATFYVSHKHTEYDQIEHLAALGHEIASFSVSRKESSAYWNRLDVQGWEDEMKIQKEIIEKYAMLGDDAVVGMRAPYLLSGSRHQYNMMKNAFQYDSSIVAPLKNQPVWPYTLDYRVPHQCHKQGKACPTTAHPGIWEMPINELDRRQPTIDPKTNKTTLGRGLSGCTLISTCMSEPTPETLTFLLENNLKRFMETTRAPMSINLDAAFLTTYPDLVPALKKWIKEKTETEEVYFVSAKDALKWMKEPTPLKEVDKFEAWKCENEDVEWDDGIACDFPTPCDWASGNRMTSCNDSCPFEYPWVGQVGEDFF